MSDSGGHIPATTFRRRHGLTIGVRTLMLVVLLFGLVFSWVYSVRRQVDAVQQIEAVQGRVVYSWDWDEREQFKPGDPPPYPRFLTSWLPWDCFGGVAYIDFTFADENASVINAILRFPHLRGLSLNAAQIDDQGLYRLRRLKKLETLDLSLTEVQGRGLRALAGMTRLEELDISTIEMNDEDLAFVTNLRRLKRLSIDSGSLSDRGYGHLKNLHRMKSLHLSGARSVTNLGYTFLVGMPDLEELELAHLELSDLSHLARHPKLTRLELRYLPIGDNSLEPLTELHGLTSLSLFGTKISDKGLKKLRSLSGLKELDLSYTQVHGPGIVELSDLPNLEKLSLSGNSLDAVAMDRVRTLKSLNYLDLYNSQISDGELKILAGMKALRVVDARKTTVTPAGVAAFKKLRPNVQAYY